MKLALYGGTFDPVHPGHLEVARAAVSELALDRLWFLVSGDPPHKRRRLTPAGHRLAMVQLVLAGEPRLDVCEVEVLRSGPSYTVDTLRAFRSLHPRAELSFLIGADSLLDLPGWREPEAILDFGVVVAPRPGFDLRSVPASLRRRVRILKSPANPASSSAVRTRLRRPGGTPPGMDPRVLAYIQAHRLFRGTRQ